MRRDEIVAGLRDWRASILLVDIHESEIVRERGELLKAAADYIESPPLRPSDYSLDAIAERMVDSLVPSAEHTGCARAGAVVALVALLRKVVQ